jgi:integrase
MASIYLRGKVLWGKWSEDGRVVRQSLGTGDRREARRVLKERMSQGSQRGRMAHVMASTITWDTASKDLLDYYRACGTRNPTEAGYILNRLTEHFGGWKLVDIDAAAITGYVVKRKSQGLTNGTVNLHLATLRKALRLAHENSKLVTAPRIQMLKANAPRSGFFEREDFEAVIRSLPVDIALALRIGYVYGWRVKSEVLTLTKGQVDLKEGTLRLEPGMSKNGEGRVVYLTDELKGGIADQISRVKVLEREMSCVIPYLFPRPTRPRRGDRIESFGKQWATACRKAGVEGKLVHDLRRSAVKEMVNRGVPERVAMKITGHKTRGIFDRYHIVSPVDLKDATRKLSLSYNSSYNLGTGGS